jgi:signal transduction histidine kinase
MADSAAVLYALGGFLVLVLLPISGPNPQRPLLVGVATLSIVTGVLLHYLAARLPLLVYHLLTAFASVLVTLAIHFGGAAALDYALFYVWIAAWAFYWFSPPLAWAEMGWLAAVSGLQLVFGGFPAGAQASSFGVVYWATMVITACSTGLLLSYLEARRLHANDQLSWRRQQLTDVMADLPLSVFAIEPTGIVSLVEGKALDRVQFTPEAVLQHSIFDLVSAENPLFGAARRALDGEEVAGALRIGDGEYEYRMSPMRGPGGSLLRVSGTLVDVTTPRRLEREAAERQARELFLAKVSHELRTPLNGMLGYLQLLGDASPSGMDDRRRGYVERIERSARLQLELVNDLLDLQRLRSGDPQFEIETVPIAMIIDEAVEVASPLAAARRIRLKVESSEGRVATDRRRVGQALLNLLSNAIKFSGPDTEVVIAAGTAAGEVSISVSDGGPGLAEADLERVFDEFYQAPSSSPREGTGLGLAISRQIVRALGGDIVVDSRPGEGATFTIRLREGAQPTR